jgi:hypothetical protein
MNTARSLFRVSAFAGEPYEVVVRACSFHEAAQIAHDFFEEQDILLWTCEVGLMGEPEDGSGVVYESNNTRAFRYKNSQPVNFTAPAPVRPQER